MNLIRLNHQNGPVRYQNQNRVYNNFSDMIDRIFSLENEYSPVSCPAANIRESNESYWVEMAVPGYDRNDIRIELDQKRLTISAEVKGDERENGYTRREFGTGSFTRRFLLPAAADTEKIGASYENGVLSVKIPKRDEAIPRPPRQIDIQ